MTTVKIAGRPVGPGQPCFVIAEVDTRMVARRSLFLTRDLAAGEALEPSSLVALRPAGGIAPNELAQLAGRTTARALSAG